MTAVPASPQPSRLAVAWFSLLNLILCLFVFRDAMWGAKLLAPLDVLPACFSKYQFVDPNATGVLAANAQFDQVTYDLPLQYGIYQSYRRGQIPWWDPYGYAGRPLLADAHVNGTDPVRLLANALLPFELAYNWTRIGHFFCSGLAMFLLLRYWRLRTWICALLALTFEFAGSQTCFFGFPWLQGAFWYYPLLWLCWDAAFHTRRTHYIVLAALAVAGIFYAGNLQSHAYVVLFAAAWAIGYDGRCLADWRKAVPILVVSGICGACLAAPALFNQLELFQAGMRGVKPALSSRVYLMGMACMTSIYPWMLGDFRTLDLRNAFFQGIALGQNYGLGFHTFIGSAGLVLAFLGACAKTLTPHQRRIRRAGVCLAGCFLVIVSSPLVTVFYTRSAGLFVLAAIVLAALALEMLAESVQKFRPLGWCVIVLALGLGVAANFATLVLYPRFVPKVRQRLEEHEKAAPQGAAFKMPAAYRAFQIDNLPNEVSFKNPETFLAFLSLLGLGGILLFPSWRGRTAVMPLLMALNLAPGVLFCARFVPRQPLVFWQRLLAGGPEQQNAMHALGPNHLRLLEAPGLRYGFIFPDELEHLYRIHTVHGYCALVPVTLSSLGITTNQAYRTDVADYLVLGGELRRNEIAGLARFHWLNPSLRTVQVEEDSLNEIRVNLTPGQAGVLLWTDTNFPGWTAKVDGQPVRLQSAPPCFTRMEVPADARIIILRYRPRFLSAAIWTSIAGALALGVLLMASRGRDRQALTLAEREPARK